MSKKPTEPTKATRLGCSTLRQQLKNLLPSDHLAHVTMKLPQVLEGNLSGPLRPYRVLFGYSNLEEIYPKAPPA